MRNINSRGQSVQCGEEISIVDILVCVYLSNCDIRNMNLKNRSIVGKISGYEITANVILKWLVDIYAKRKPS